MCKWLSNLLLFLLLSSCADQKQGADTITPNQFEGSDVQRIQAAVDSAKGTTNKIFIPSGNANGTNKWLLDSAILLPSNMTVILDNCMLQLSDQSRDNMFRSDNVGVGIREPNWNHNISIIGIGDVVLKGADNPRATGDGARDLVPSPRNADHWRVSYGSDAGKEGVKQTGDWRNIMILMAYVKGFTLKNVKIENSHAWAVSHERVRNAEISDIRFNNPDTINVNGRKVHVSNKDGINLRHGCKNFRIDNISGRTGDDFIALSSLDTRDSTFNDTGILNSTMVTTRKWRGPEGDTEQISITNINCRTRTRGIAIRASDSASIHDVHINGLMTLPWGGYHNAILIGGKGYGKINLPGKINNIKAMNIMGNGDFRSLMLIEAPIADCYFMNGMADGDNGFISYAIDRDSTENVFTKNMMKISSD